MKVRQGFVSNSSSSSFVIITTPEGDYKNNPDLSEDIKAVYNDAFYSSKGKIDGKEVIIYEGYQSDETNISNSREFRNYCDKNNISDDDFWEIADELLDKFFGYFEDNKTIVKWIDC